MTGWLVTFIGVMIAACVVVAIIDAFVVSQPESGE